MIALLSGQLDVTGNEITGCVYQRKRKGDRVGVWTKTKTDIDIQGAIGHLLYNSVWNVPENTTIEVFYIFIYSILLILLHLQQKEKNVEIIFYINIQIQ